MPLVTLKEILKNTVEERYAVGGFATINDFFTEAILEAGEEKNAPIILMVPDVVFDIMDAHKFFSVIHERIKDVSIPVALHLDHGTSFQKVIQAIRAGCTSVMLDCSTLPFRENVEQTKKVIKIAQLCDVSVEAEIGHVAGLEGNANSENQVAEDAFTIPSEAIEFIEKTKVDALAIAIGTVHGVYKSEPKLDIGRLKEIRANTRIPLVLHGSSGVSQDQIKEAINGGVNKINIFTSMSTIAAQTVKEQMNHHPQMRFHELLPLAKQAVKETVKEYIDIFKNDN